MRALCGAIIAAGALFGLGLTAIGFGIRYQAVAVTRGGDTWLHLRDLDTPLLYLLVLQSAVLVIGLAIAFVGLAFHHERRHWERQHLHLRGPEHGIQPPRS